MVPILTPRLCRFLKKNIFFHKYLHFYNYIHDNVTRNKNGTFPFLYAVDVII